MTVATSRARLARPPRALEPAFRARSAPAERRRRRPRAPPGREVGVTVLHRRQADRRAQADSPRWRVRGRDRRRRAAAALPARDRLRRRRQVHDRRPVRVPADDRRARPVPDRRGPPRGALRQARALTCGRSNARPRSTRDGHRVRGLGAVGPRGQRRRRLQLMGRPPARDALARVDRRSGSCSSPAIGPGAHYKYEILTQDHQILLKADPYALADRGSAEDRVGRVPARAHLERGATATGWRAGPRRRRRSERPVSIYEVHLGSWRLNSLEGNRSLTYVELADELSRLRQGHGLHARRAAAGDGAPVQGLVGLPGHRLLRAHAVLRLARRLPRSSSTGCTSTASA